MATATLGRGESIAPALPRMRDGRSALPAWAQAGQRQYIDPRTSAYFRAQDRGDGSETLGTGTGEGFYSGLGDDLFDQTGQGLDAGRRINFDRLDSFLGDRRLVEIGGGPGNRAVRFLEGADGSVQGPVDEFTYTDKNFSNAVLGAMALTGANIGLAGLGAGSTAAAGVPAATPGAITMGAPISNVAAGSVAAAAPTTLAGATGAAVAPGAAGATGAGVVSGGSGLLASGGGAGGLTLGTGGAGLAAGGSTLGAGIGSSLPAVGASVISPTLAAGGTALASSGAAALAGSAAPAASSLIPGLTNSQLVGAGLSAVGAIQQGRAAGAAQDATNRALDQQGRLVDQQVELGREQVNLARQIFEANQKRNEDFDPRFREILDASLASMRTQEARSADQWNEYLTTFRPIERKLADTAINFDTAGRRRAAADEAVAAVENQAAGQRQQMSRALGRAGVTLDSGRALTLDNQARMATAKAAAGADRTARDRVEQTGINLLGTAANLGRGFPATAQAASGGSLAAGQAAGGTMGQQTNVAGAGAGQVLGAYQSAQAGLGSAVGGNSSIVNANLAMLNNANAQMAGLGQFAGQLLGGPRGPFGG